MKFAKFLEEDGFLYHRKYYEIYILCLTPLVVFFIALTLAIACVSACNPKGSNKPQCDDSNVEKRIRNFNDPNRYWLCKSAGSEPESVRCEKEQAFDEGKGECIPFKDFKWTKPCA